MLQGQLIAAVPQHRPRASHTAPQEAAPLAERHKPSRNRTRRTTAARSLQQPHGRAAWVAHCSHTGSASSHGPCQPLAAGSMGCAPQVAAARATRHKLSSHQPPVGSLATAGATSLLPPNSTSMSLGQPVIHQLSFGMEVIDQWRMQSYLLGDCLDRHSLTDNTLDVLEQS
jgi:hypothetical protein